MQRAGIVIRSEAKCVDGNNSLHGAGARAGTGLSTSIGRSTCVRVTTTDPGVAAVASASLRMLQLLPCLGLQGKLLLLLAFSQEVARQQPLVLLLGVHWHAAAGLMNRGDGEGHQRRRGRSRQAGKQVGRHKGRAVGVSACR